MTPLSLFAPVWLAALSLPQSSPDRAWPAYGGPDADGRGPAVDSDFAWSEGGPRRRWSVELGPGFGGAAVADGEVFVIDREPGERETLRVFSLETGEPLWSDSYAADGSVSYSGSRTVPTVTDEFVYATGPLGHVTAWNRRTHEVAFALELERDLGGRRPFFGWSASPLVVGDLLIVAPLGEDCGLAALDRRTGETKWKTPGIGYSHSSPVLLHLLGRDQIVMGTAPEPASGRDEAAPAQLFAFDPADGSELWSHEMLLARIPIPPPVRIDDERILVTGGYKGGTSLLILLEEEGEVVLEELFHVERGSQLHRPVLFEDHLYFLANENWNDDRRRQAEGGLVCLDLDGNEKWRTGADPYMSKGGWLLLGSHLLVQDGRDGRLRVVDPTPEGYRPLAEADVFGTGDRGDHQMWAPLAAADGCLLMRSQESLVCVEL